LTILQVKKYYTRTSATRVVKPEAMNSPLFTTRTNPPSLIGQHCNSCHRDTFPGNPFGCEACGAEADSLVEAEFEGQGQLQAFATTMKPSIQTEESGFTIGVIELEQGFKIRAMMDPAHQHSLKPGIGVHAVVTKDDDGQPDGIFFTPSVEAGK
jgi:uncharacterized protein